MNYLEAARRIVLWAIELSEFDIQYFPRTAIKAQALADFILEFTAKEAEGYITLGMPSTWGSITSSSSIKNYVLTFSFNFYK